MKLYFHQETGNVYQKHDGRIYAHPIYENDHILNLDVDADLEWTVIDGLDALAEPNVVHEGKEIRLIEFTEIVEAKLA